MSQKKQIETKKTIRTDDTVSVKGGSSENTEDLLMDPGVPELTLAEQQELTNRIVSTIMEKRSKRLTRSEKLTLLRDIIGCSDSILIKVLTYLVATLALLGIAAGLYFVASHLIPSQVSTQAGCIFRALPACLARVAHLPFTL